MNSFTKRDQVVILMVVLVIISIIGYKLISRNVIMAEDKTPEFLELVKMPDLVESDIINVEVENQIIMVHISGQVYKPGIIELELGKRVVDAVELAGGLKSNADLDRINLAKKLIDEEKIYIPEIGEEVSENLILVSSQDKENGKVNINNCSKDALISLPGIGEVTANKIIEYRSKNKFKTIEDIKNISGIGDKKFEAIKELIIVK